MATKFWLMKTEPDAFSIRDLQSRPGKKEGWDGVRNYQARNNMRDGMSVGDKVLFYHSSCDPAGVAGLARISKAAYEDVSALDPRSKYYDPKAKPGANPWVMVEVEFQEEFARIITLDEMRETPGLEAMAVLQRGSRLSVQPVRPGEFEIVRKLAATAPRTSGPAGTQKSPKSPKPRKANREKAANIPKPKLKAAKKRARVSP